MKKPILFAVLFVMVLASVAAILQSGWTSTTVPSVARTALGVPGLTNNNVFTGSNYLSGYIANSNGIGTNIALIGATNFGTGGRSNWTTMSADGWLNTNNSAANQGVSIHRGQMVIDGGGTNTTQLRVGTLSTGFFISTNGNVGIGIDSPGIAASASRRYLTVKGLSGAGVTQMAGGEADADAIGLGLVEFVDANNLYRAAYISGNLSGTTANNRGGRISFGTKLDGGAAAERMRIQNTGLVGIGTTDPWDLLEVNKSLSGGVGGRILIGNSVLPAVNNEVDLAFRANNSFLTSNYYSGRIVNITPVADNMSDFAFFLYQSAANPSGIEMLRIKNNGSVGVGTNAPNATLHVNGDSNIRTNIAQFDVTISNFVIGTRYTNSNRRSFVAASFQLAAAVAGTAAVTMNVEQAGTTNKLTVSAGPLAGMTTIEPLSLLVGPGAFYYFTDTSSGAGAVATIVAGTSSQTSF